MYILKKEHPLYIDNMKEEKYIYIYRKHPDVNFGQIGSIIFENGTNMFVPDGEKKGYIISLDHIWLCNQAYNYEAFNTKVENVNEICKK